MCHLLNGRRVVGDDIGEVFGGQITKGSYNSQCFRVSLWGNGKPLRVLYRRVTVRPRLQKCTCGFVQRMICKGARNWVRGCCRI